MVVEADRLLDEATATADTIGGGTFAVAFDVTD
jgi:hypothetical protein